MTNKMILGLALFMATGPAFGHGFVRRVVRGTVHAGAHVVHGTVHAGAHVVHGGVYAGRRVVRGAGRVVHHIVHPCHHHYYCR